MPLVTCPDCGRSVADAAMTCIHCGSPLMGRATATDTAPPPASSGYTPPRGDASRGAEPLVLPFFEVGVRKFVVMSIFTWGLYDLYWSYQQWVRIRDRGREHLSPFWRTFFAYLWGFSLFARVSEEARRKHMPVAWDSSLLGAVYFALGIAWRLPDPWWFVSLFAFVPVVPVVRTIVALHDRLDPDGERDRNARFGDANWIGIAVGFVFTLMVILGLMIE